MTLTKEQLKAEIKRRLAEKAKEREARKPVDPAPRYDEVFWKGLEWLNSL